MYKELLQYVLPQEIATYFDLVNLQEIKDTLHLYLEENNTIPDDCKLLKLSSNGFYEESQIKDFPLRDKKVILHICRRRRVDETGKSYSRKWNLVAEGTRYSKEFASFLKECFGYLPDTSPIT